MARPKVILNLYPMLPAADEEERKRLRPLGRNKDLYHEVLMGWLDVVKEADKMGVWGACAIEHHLHSEGYEMCPNPGVINAWWASQVKNLHVGAMGYVMAAQDPIRVAEETAIIDHMTEGKFFVGLARGYQSRWTNILGQASKSTATVSDGSDNDIKNRDIFEERVEMLLKCWKDDSVALDGKYYQAPFPAETGVVGYPAWKIARDAGAHGEIDEEGVVRRVSVVPKPYQSPHPPVFIATAKSDESIKFAARNGFHPTYFTKNETFFRQASLYVEEAASHGLKVKLGEKQNIVRWPHIGKSEAEYHEKLRKYDLDIYKNFYARFFPMFPSDPDIDWVKNITESGMFSGGTLEQVRAEWIAMYKQVPAEYITLIFHYAQQPKEDVIEELRLFMTEIVPHLECAD